MLWRQKVFAFRRSNCIECSDLHAHICFDVKVSCIGAFMSQPECDHFRCHTSLQQVHGGRVAKSVRRNAAASQRGSALCSSVNELSKPPSDSGPSSLLNNGYFLESFSIRYGAVIGKIS